MIDVRLFKTEAGGIYGFEIKNHGKKTVCAAVSALALNAVNGIEAFTEDEFTCDADKSGGYLKFEHPLIKSGGTSKDASLLLNSMALGLYAIRAEYGGEINIAEERRKV